MKTLPVMVIVCVVTTLTGADAPPEEKSSDIQTAWSPPIESFSHCRGWFKYEGRCFLYVPRSMTWGEAEKNCQSLGGNLASIRNVYEYHMIQTLILRHTHGYPETWIGGSDAQQEGFWLWTDGRHFHYSNWCPGEPNNDRGQHCIQINYGASKCWDDVECYYHLPSVCAKKMG